MLALSIIVSVDGLFLRGPPLESEYSNVSPSEGRVAQGVAEGVDGGVDVTEAVGKHPDKGWNHVLNQIISYDIRMK